MQTINDTTMYEELDTVDDHDIPVEENDSTPSCMPFLRQLLLSSTLWTVYFLYGLKMGTPTVLIPQLRKELSVEIDDETGSWITSMFTIGQLPWVFIVPFFANVYGKKGAFIIVNIFAFIGYLVIYLSNGVTQLFIGDLILGLMLGALQTIGPITISEYTSPKYRGLFMTIKSACGFWGMRVSNFIGTFWHWKNIAIVAFICNAYTLTVFAWPESPYWLAQKGRYVECTKAHRWLKGVSPEATRELHQLITSHKFESAKKVKHKSISTKEFFNQILETVTCKAFYKPVIAITLLALQYYFAGKLVCSMYAIEILKKITNDNSTAYKDMLILDGVTVFSAYCGCVLAKYFKRRTFLLSTATFGIIFLYTLSLYLYLIHKSIITENSIVTISLLAFFSITVTSGPMMLLTSVYGELIPVRFQRSAGIVFGIVSSSLMICTIKFGPFLFKTLSLSGAFLFFAIISTVVAVLVYIYLPETKDKTLHEIEEYFTGSSKSPQNESKCIQSK